MNFFITQIWRLWVEIEAHKWRDLELNLSKTAPGLSAYSSQQHEKAERQQKTSRVQFCSNLVPNHFTGLSVAPRSLADSVHRHSKGYTYQTKL